MENKITYEELDSLKTKAQAALVALKKALGEANSNPAYKRMCEDMYHTIGKMPAGVDLMGSPLGEDVVISAKAGDSTLRRAEDIAKKNNTNIALKESGTEPTDVPNKTPNQPLNQPLNEATETRWGFAAQGYWYGSANDSIEAEHLIERWLRSLDTPDGTHFRVTEVFNPKPVETYDDPDAHKGMDDAYMVKGESVKMTIGELKESLGIKGKVITETMSLKEFKSKYIG